MKRATLVALARASSLHEVQDDGCRHIITNKETGVAVAVYENGAPHRADVDLSITTNMTIRASAGVLDLPADKQGAPAAFQSSS
ncbi:MULTISPECIES: hypothetical protein [unclassified Variovorax]|uniref:hypothetical protein n=1 Tax=unclassified Variovorax TaxID=663243 RepID=UPI00076D0ACC|nr:MULTISPECIES: hypothetical protein [unclassified Variovorax]KWT95607.1 hypothetical protein APY03_2484 [Variovorax sp. WDL1]PNG50218.1 hypothetical protein CHC06_05841 [Variovorax sp. B2]PNG51091.1 hypothetical protein CHC07_05747 [Variovorax sp. B4]VTU42382.1 hypothetical protein SRS16P1_00256 [Variovorax sp. SRS16]VTU42409.1 hypothetical protein E5P1_00254 [Variovorax sp. PBL-E5]